ncbi:MAG: NUDIX domain-containing protein [Bacteroidales bacterium]|nr:NUDIX domain-containing protein [Bacteroidales bacterium]
MGIDKFNIRVYGLIFNEKQEVMLADEYVLDTYMTKFPGGGLKFGEGPADCIKREAIEEFGQEIEISEHFYTTDFFQPTLFYKDMQLICIYYIIKFTGSIQFKISTEKFDFPQAKNGSISFRWADVGSLKPEELTFPIDKHVVKLLKEKYTS